MSALGTVLPIGIAFVVSFNGAIVPPAAEREGIVDVLPASRADSEGTTDDERRASCRTLNDHCALVAPSTREAWTERAAALRRRVQVAAGLWPMPERTPLSPVIHGRVERGDYTVEKVYFESRPGLVVTGSLYRPVGRGDGPHAAVLSPHGHFSGGRFCTRTDAEVERQMAHGWETIPAAARYHIQARCVQLARMGCVVFHYDMVGYADARQLPHGGGFGTVQSELNLRSAFGVQTWNSIRALDFLAGLPDVDPARIGVTGASGGGTQTFILCAIDPRPDAAFAAVMVSTGMQGGCVCENASHLRVGTNNVELAALFAPRPLALTGANDWTLHIETDGYPELKEIYRLFGKPENVFAKCFPTFEHNYNEHSRRLMYSWFNRHLGLGLPEPIRERSFLPLTAAELTVFDDEHPRPAPCTDPTAAAVEPAPLPEDPAEYARVVGGALSTLVASELPSEVEVQVLIERVLVGHGPTKVRDLVLSRPGSGEAMRALLFLPEGWSGGTIAVVIPAGGIAEVMDPETGPTGMLERLLEFDGALLVPEVLLAGVEDARLPVDEGRHGQYVGYTWGYNRTLLAERVHDVLTAIGYARELSTTDDVLVVGSGEAGPWVVLAAALAGDAVTGTVASRSWTFADVDSLNDPRFLPGALRYGDVAGFARLVPANRLVLVDGPHIGLDVLQAMFRRP